MAVKSSSQFNKFTRYVSLTWEIVSLNISSAMEYRISFLSQVLGIILNDISHLLIWAIFFGRFQTINGWQIHDMMLMLSVFFTVFGVHGIFGGGLLELAKYIARGELDYFLTFPKNVLWHSVVNRTEIPSIGDFILGIIIFLFLTGPLTFEKILVFILVSLISTAILFNFTITTQSLPFYLGNFEESADRWLWTLFGMALYPQTIFTGWLKVFTLTILPTFFLVYLPVGMLKNFSWADLGIMLAFAVGTFFLAIFVFYRGLRRYESGNLINIRV